MKIVSIHSHFGKMNWNRLIDIGVHRTIKTRKCWNKMENFLAFLSLLLFRSVCLLLKRQKLCRFKSCGFIDFAEAKQNDQFLQHCKSFYWTMVVGLLLLLLIFIIGIEKYAFQCLVLHWCCFTLQSISPCRQSPAYANLKI